MLPTIQGVPEKTLFCVQRPITHVWKQLFSEMLLHNPGLLGLKWKLITWGFENCPYLSQYLLPNLSYRPLNTKERFFWDTLYKSCWSQPGYFAWFFRLTIRTFSRWLAWLRLLELERKHQWLSSWLSGALSLTSNICHKQQMIKNNNTWAYSSLIFMIYI